MAASLSVSQHAEHPFGPCLSGRSEPLPHHLSATPLSPTLSAPAAAEAPHGLYQVRGDKSHSHFHSHSHAHPQPYPHPHPHPHIHPHPQSNSQHYFQPSSYHQTHSRVYQHRQSRPENVLGYQTLPQPLHPRPRPSYHSGLFLNADTFFPVQSRFQHPNQPHPHLHRHPQSTGHHPCMPYQGPGQQYQGTNHLPQPESHYALPYDIQQQHILHQYPQNPDGHYSFHGEQTNHKADPAGPCAPRSSKPLHHLPHATRESFENPAAIVEPGTPLSDETGETASNPSDTSSVSTRGTNDNANTTENCDANDNRSESAFTESASAVPTSPSAASYFSRVESDVSAKPIDGSRPPFANVGDIPDARLADTIAWVLNNFCANNKTARPQFPQPHEDAALFFSPVRQKTFTLNFYCKRLIDYTHCSKSCFVVAILYIVRLSERYPVFELNDFNVHRLISTAVVLAAKFNDDMTYSNSHYARVAGIQSTSEMNKLEALMLKALDYRLFVSVENYEEAEKQIAFIAREYVS